ncbi:MAG: hypothetical protein ABL914_10875 [Novosphingobium sp.]|uniref:VpaChn25_0724 family phage protein n=1 Tax=Novosphingobium sp. TaxID=1874826 RepID=UPI0032BB97A1
MGFTQDMGDALTGDARLAILAELAQQRDETLNVLSITRLVDALGIRRSREWIDTQLGKLEELGAIELRQSEIAGLGTVSVATLTAAGRDHVERRSTIAGVSAPRVR